LDIIDQPGIEDEPPIEPTPSTLDNTRPPSLDIIDQPSIGDEPGQPPADFAIEIDPPATYRLQQTATKSFRGNVLTEQTYSVQFTDHWQPGLAVNLTEELRAVFQELLDTALGDFIVTDMARIYITHPVLRNAIIIPPRLLGTLNPDVILESIANVLQSAEDLPIDVGFRIQLGVARILRGAKGTTITNVNKARMSKTSLVAIRNDDNLCLPRS
jgi:hypothetical protein